MSVAGLSALSLGHLFCLLFREQLQEHLPLSQVGRLGQELPIPPDIFVVDEFQHLHLLERKQELKHWISMVFPLRRGLRKSRFLGAVACGAPALSYSGNQAHFNFERNHFNFERNIEPSSRHECLKKEHHSSFTVESNTLDHR